MTAVLVRDLVSSVLASMCCEEQYCEDYGKEDYKWHDSHTSGYCKCYCTGFCKGYCAGYYKGCKDGTGITLRVTVAFRVELVASPSLLRWRRCCWSSHCSGTSAQGMVTNDSTNAHSSFGHKVIIDFSSLPPRFPALSQAAGRSLAASS